MTLATSTSLIGFVSPNKTIASALSSVIKTAGRQPVQCAMAARRLLSQLDDGTYTLLFAADKVYIDDEPIMEMKEGSNMWILPLFIVGVRSIALDQYTTTNDIMALGYEIATLRLHSDAMEDFRDWVWAGGSGGIEITISETFMDVMDSMDMGEGSARFGSQGSLLQPAELEELQSLRLHDDELTIASLRPEFQTSIDMFTQGMLYRGFEILEPERQTLQATAHTSNKWLHDGIASLLTMPRLQKLTPSGRIAHAIIDHLRPSMTRTLHQTLRLLFDDNQPYAQSIIQALYKLDLGQYMGTYLCITSDDGTLLQRNFNDLIYEQKQALAITLLERAAHDPTLPLTQIIEQISPRAWIEALMHAKISETQAKPHLQALLELKISPEQLADILDNFEDATLVHLLELIPDQYLTKIENRMKRLFQDAERRFIEELLPQLLSRRFNGILDMVADTMLHKKELDWSRKTIKLACTSILEFGMGEKYLIELVRSRSVYQPVREIALESLEQSSNQKLLEAATKFRFTEYFEPSDFRNRIKSNRTKSAPKLKNID